MKHFWTYAGESGTTLNKLSIHLIIIFFKNPLKTANYLKR